VSTDREFEPGRDRAWQPLVYDVHPLGQAIRGAVERRREAESTGLTTTEAESARRLAAAAGRLEIWDVTAEPEPVDLRPLNDYSAIELDRDLMVKEGWPRAAAEQMALQHAREQALNEVQADLEAG
jgi:hypothetical protein